MSRTARFLGLLLAAFVVLPACGSPFIKGWRNNKQDQRTEQERCEAAKGYKWINNSCQKEGSFSLNGIGEADCQKIENASWRSNQCVYNKDLKSAADCQSVGWAWAEDRCMLPAEAQCRADKNSDWVEDHCATRPTLTLDGNTTQVLAVGNTFQPLPVTLSDGATLSLEKQTCDGFFVIDTNKITSTPAKSATNCEADVVATRDGARSEPLHLKATVDEGFLSLCNKFQNMEEARKDRLLARTVFVLKAASGKATCSDAATELAGVTNLKIVSSALVDLRPLTGLTNLTVLDLTDNEVADLTPVAYLPNLSVLMISGNPIVQAKKTEKNCPTNDDVNFAVSDFCLGQ